MPTPEVMIVVNVESGKIYRVVQVKPNGSVDIERLGDGYAVNVGARRFPEIYTPATPEQLAKIEQVLNLFTSRGTPMTVDALNAVNVPPPGADGEVGSAPLGLGDIGRQVGDLITPDPNIHKLENMILYPECVEAAMMGINQISRAADIEEVFQISKIQPKAGRCAINMYGPPGVGKTMLALAIALTLNKKLYKVDYSQMISKWVGDTGKNIKAAFAAAKAADAILLFDEADSMLSRRQTITEDAVSNSVNQNRNILMQELDDYNGIVFFTTNKFENYDEALLRRIAAHVRFELPNEEMREKLFSMHFTNHDRLKDVEFKKCAKVAKSFSGGDILNVCVNSMRRTVNLSPNKAEWFVTQEMVEAEIKRIGDAKKEHSGKPGKAKPMGLNLAGD